MISIFRGNKAGHKYLILGMLGIFIFSGTGLFVGLFNRDTKGVIATVNGYAITDIEFRFKAALYDQRIREIKQQFGQYASLFLQQQGLAEDPSVLAVNELVQEKLLEGIADKMHLHYLSDSYVSKKLADRNFALHYLNMIVPQFLYNTSGQLDCRALSNYLKRQGMSYGQFEHKVESALKNMFIVSLLSTLTYVSEQAVQNALLQENSQRTFSITHIPLSVYEGSLRTAVSPEEIHSYFLQANKNGKRYWSPEKRSGKAYVMKADDYGIEISTADIKKEYEAQKNKWQNKSLDQVKPDIVKTLKQQKFIQRFTADVRRIIAQHNMAALEQFMKKHNARVQEIPMSAVKEGDQLSEKLFSINASGKAASGIINGDGCVVILENIIGQKQLPFNEVAQQVEKDFIQEKALKLLEKDMKMLSAHFSQETYTSYVKKHGLKTENRVIDGSKKEAWEQLEQAGLPVHQMKKMSHNNDVLITPLRDNSVELIVQNAITANASSYSNANKNTIRERIISENTTPVIHAFIDSSKNNAIIKYKDNMRIAD